MKEKAMFGKLFSKKTTRRELTPDEKQEWISKTSVGVLVRENEHFGKYEAEKRYVAHDVYFGIVGLGDEPGKAVDELHKCGKVHVRHALEIGLSYGDLENTDEWEANLFRVSDGSPVDLPWSFFMPFYLDADEVVAAIKEGEKA